MDSFVARQPIFDRSKRVMGYELLFRSSETSESYTAMDGDAATSQLIANWYFAIGYEKLTAGKRGFVNFTHDLLVADMPSVLPPEGSVIEILETVEPDEEVLHACRSLRARGYLLALDDFVCQEKYEPLTRVADIIKVDFLHTSPAECARLVKRYAQRGIKMLAEKVELPEQFQNAFRLGYSYFQGYFFARPVIISGEVLPAFKRHYLNLLQVVQQPEIDLQQVEEAVQEELSLTYKLLSYINSARLGRLFRIESVKHALAILGEDEIRKWVSLAVVTGIGQDHPRELVVTAMLRARFCELLAPLAEVPDKASRLFLMGMFSILDTLLNRPLEELLEPLCLEPDVVSALLRKSEPGNSLSTVLELVLAYEASDWDTVSILANKLIGDRSALPGLYLDSVAWSERIFT